eukprot:sb/3474159/
MLSCLIESKGIKLYLFVESKGISVLSAVFHAFQQTQSSKLIHSQPFTAKSLDRFGKFNVYLIRNVKPSPQPKPSPNFNPTSALTLQTVRADTPWHTLQALQDRCGVARMRGLQRIPMTLQTSRFFVGIRCRPFKMKGLEGA